MRPRVHRFASFVAILFAAVTVGTAAGAPPKLAAKRAEAQRVIAQIGAIDARLGVVTEQYDGARVHLQQVRARLQLAQRALGRARVQNRRAQLDEARLLVSLYVTGRPTALEVLLGANSVSDLLRLSDAEDAISREVAAVADAATKAKRRLAERVLAVQADRRSAERTVRELAARRSQIEHGLARRRVLLASVQSEITRMVARQRALQARLAAQARARLAAAAAARARAAAAAAAHARALALRRARAQAAAVAAAAAAARAAQAEQTTTTVPQATITTDVAAARDPAAPIPPPTTAGHPQAAQVALQYIGVPYLWGGASPDGFDCSGLVSYVFAQLGIALPHYAAAQYSYGDPVAASDLQAGDLVFFDALNHVGIYIGDGQYVDAPETGSFVKIESLGDPWAVANYVGARRI